MKVWIVQGHVDYEGSEIVGVYASKEQAKASHEDVTWTRKHGSWIADNEAGYVPNYWTITDYEVQ